MRDQISAAVGPLDFLEEIWVNDVVSLVWETQRLRRLRVAFFHVAVRKDLYQVLKPSSDPSSARRLADNWASHKPDAVAEVDARLAAAFGLTMDCVIGDTLARKLDEVERIDRMVAGAEARRNVALREIDRHRATLGAALRQAADEVLDAEFTEIPPRLTKGETV
jgi:hypothetical protein